MSSASRRRGLRAVALIAATGSLTAGFGLVDLTSPFFLHEGGQVYDVGYGALAGILVPVAFLSQLRSPARRTAGVQLAALCALSYLAAGILGHDRDFFPFAALIGGAAALVAALHPARARVLAPGRVRPLLVVPAVAGAVPLVAYALARAADQRHGVPPFDEHAHLGQWAALTAAALATALAALLAALGTDGFAIPAAAASAAAAVWGLAGLVYPGHAGAEGRGWAAAALVWALAFAAAAERERRRPGTATRR